MFRKIASANLLSIIVFGSLGGHKYEWDKHRKNCFNTAQLYQLISTVGIYMCSNIKNKYVIPVYILIQIGGILFPGHLYMKAFYNDNRYRLMAPIGGVSLMIGTGLLCLI